MRVGIFVVVATAACGRLGFDTPAIDAATKPPDAVGATVQWLMTADYNGPSGNLAVYRLDPSTGTLAPTGQGAVPSRTKPAYFGVTPDGKYVYIPHENANSEISAFAIDGKTGYLTELAGSPFPGSGTTNQILLIHPSGKFLYSSGTGGIQCYLIDDTTGVIAKSGTPTIVPLAFQMSIDPGGRFLYSVPYTAGDIYGFRIDPATCALTSIGPALPNGTGDVHGVAVDRQGKFLVIQSTTNVRVYSIDQVDGTLTLVQGPVVGGGVWVSFDPQGDHVVVAAQGSGIRSYAFDQATGGLTAASGSPYVNGVSYWFAITDDAGAFAYGADDASALIYPFRLDRTDGSLALLPGSPVSGVATAFGMAVFATN